MATRNRQPIEKPGKRADAPDERLILYVHGIGDQPPADDLKRDWDLALFGREMGSRTRMVYWSDILSDVRRARTIAKASSESGINVDLLLRQAGVNANNVKAQRLARTLLRTMGAESDSPRSPRKKVLPLPAFLRKPIARAFLEALIKDTAAYFFLPKKRQQIQQRLRDALAATNDSVVIVAHSQGTIVALEVLAELASETPVKVDHLITIGSPLGIREVQDFLSCKLEVPRGVKAWHNFADPLDPVALDKGIRSDFEPERFITDELVLNSDSRKLEGFNPHSAAGYLAHPRVRSVVCGAARVDSHARFLMARDVAADLAVEARHPVLIEILEPGYQALDESYEQMKTRGRNRTGRD
jgi:hypothetical protein